MKYKNIKEVTEEFANKSGMIPELIQLIDSFDPALVCENMKALSDEIKTEKDKIIAELNVENTGLKAQVENCKQDNALLLAEILKLKEVI